MQGMPCRALETKLVGKRHPHTMTYTAAGSGCGLVRYQRTWSSGLLEKATRIVGRRRERRIRKAASETDRLPQSP